jgi:hypothetical protein
VYFGTRVPGSLWNSVCFCTCAHLSSIIQVHDQRELHRLNSVPGETRVLGQDLGACLHMHQLRAVW